MAGQRAATDREVFQQALALGPDERAVYLDEACRDNAALRREVESLLEAHAAAGSFMKEPAVERADDSGALTAGYQQVDERPGAMIGPYKLMEQIGEGGFGLVFVAEQHQPVRRKVALKIIKPGMDSRDVIARFEAERQALALMDHPNIAKVFDAGTTASGRPYFVMELVRGVPITEFCDQRQLTPGERLALFISVCHAIQHAHQKGIIHRDVKPTNMMVTLHDGRPVVKVIDFGVAKALSQQLTDRTVYTRFAQLLGTPLYMSPEQAEMSGLDIDTRSDIYSLGVLLYELLTGTTPFDRQRLNRAAALEIRRILCEEEPPRPSMRLSQSGDRLPSIAAQRNTEPAKLTKLMRGDLDWIVMKCLEKDRNRRYETANGLARDIERFLQNEPVTARPPSGLYRFQKLVRRNKLPFAAAVGIIAALVVGTIVSTWQAVRATRAEALAHERLDAEMKARQEATAAQTEAEANFQKAFAAVDAMLTEVGEESLANIPQMEPVRRALLEKALGFYQAFLAEKNREPRVRAETGRAYRRVSEIYYLLGEHLEAEHACRESILIFEALHREFPDAINYREEAARSYHRLGVLVWKMKEQFADSESKAEAAYRQALAHYEQLATRYPDEPLYRHEWANTYGDMGRLLTILRRDSEAESCYRTAIRLNEALAGQFPASLEYRRFLGTHYGQLADLLQQSGRRAEAEHCLHEALKLHRSLAADSDLPDDRRALGLSVYRLTKFLSGQDHKAESAFREAASLQERLVEEFPNVWDYRWELTYTLDDFGKMLRRQNRHQEARAQFGRAADVYQPTVLHRERLVSEYPKEKGHQIWLASSYQRLGKLLQDAGRVDEAIELYQKAIAFQEKLVTEQSVRPFILAATYISLGQASVARAAQSVAAYQRAATLLAETLPDASHKPDPMTLNSAAWYLATLPHPNYRDATRAVELAQTAVKLASSDGNVWNTLGVAHYYAGQYQAAVDALNKSTSLRGGGDSLDWFFLAMAEWQLGNHEAAHTWHLKAVEWMETNKPNDEELIRFEAEAAELLGVSESPSTSENDVGQRPAPPEQVKSPKSD